MDLLDSILLSIEGIMLAGLLLGMLVGAAFPRQRLGCFVLLAVPILMIAFISDWQARHPENLRSTSGLDFVFGALWVCLGALPGYYAGRLARAR